MNYYYEKENGNEYIYELDYFVEKIKKFKLDQIILQEMVIDYDTNIYHCEKIDGFIDYENDNPDECNRLCKFFDNGNRKYKSCIYRKRIYKDSGNQYILTIKNDKPVLKKIKE